MAPCALVETAARTTPPPLVGWVPRPAFDAALGSGPSPSLSGPCATVHQRCHPVTRSQYGQRHTWSRDGRRSRSVNHIASKWAESSLDAVFRSGTISKDVLSQRSDPFLPFL